MSPATEDFTNELTELQSAEEFLAYFGIDYDAQVLRVHRLHILQRFHDYLSKEPNANAVGDDVARAQTYRRLLRQAYEDFVSSDALTEKVFAVFHHSPLPEGGQSTFVPLDKVFK